MIICISNDSIQAKSGPSWISEPCGWSPTQAPFPRCPPSHWEEAPSPLPDKAAFEWGKVGRKITQNVLKQTNTNISLRGVLQQFLDGDRLLCNLQYMWTITFVACVTFLIDSNWRSICDRYLDVNLEDFIIIGLELDDRHLRAAESFLKMFSSFHTALTI